MPDSSRKQLVVPQGVPHSTLYRQLLEWREQAAQRNGRPAAEVLPALTLRDLVTYLPTAVTQLGEIRGIGKARRRRYGQEIIEIIQQYLASPQASREKGLPTSSKRPQSRTSDTKRHTFDLFRAGKSVGEIAAERRLVRSTIEGHLAHFIGVGELNVHSVLDPEKVAEIQQFLKDKPEAGVAEAKSHFGEKYSHGELRMVMSHNAATREVVKAN